MPGKSRRFPPVLGGALGALLIALGLSGTALAQQPRSPATARRR